MAIAPKIGITGLPSVGKTATVLKIVQMLESEDRIVGGMVTPPIEEASQRVGFRIINWLTKEEDTLAHINLDSEVRVGKYGVNVEVLEKIGVPSVEQAIREAEVIVVDEVGKMEMVSPSFCVAVKQALDINKAMVMTLHKKSRHPLLQDIRRRDDIRILEVTPVTRNLLPYKVVRLLRGEAVG